MRAAHAAFVVLFAVYAYQTVAGAYAEYNSQAGLARATPLYGIYDVERFSRNDKDVAPLTTDRKQWRRVVMESPRVVRVQLMDDSFERYRAEYNESARRLTLYASGTTSDPSSAFVWSVRDADHVELDGHIRADTVVVSLKRIDPASFLLMNRGFHWIQRNSLIQ
jgi:hypothetical protein